MKKATLDQTSYAWKQIANRWEKYFTPPSRPSVGEVKKYKDWLVYISKYKKGLNALVLGATPELRDLLNQLGFRSHVIDINIEMILALEGLVKHKNSEEVLIKANWLKNPLGDLYFDVILGDAVIPNLPWEQREVFYKEIKRLLKPKGYFLNRAFFAPARKRYLAIEDILKVFSKKKASYKTALELVFEIQLLIYDPKDHLASQEKVREVVEKLRDKNGFNFKSIELNKTLDIIWEYWVSTISKKVWVYPLKKEEESEYRNYFKIQEIFSTKDQPYGDLTPMYLLQNKK